MSMCAVCHRDADPGLHACPAHLAELRGWLAELPRLVQLLADEFIAAGGAPAQGRLGGTGRATAPVPVDLRVLNLLGPGHVDPQGPDDDGDMPILARLSGWAGFIAYRYTAVTRDHHGTIHTQPCEQAVPRQGGTVAGWCAWLTAYLPHAATHTWIGDLHHDLARLIHRVRDLTHTVPHDHPVPAPCPRCDARALLATDGQWGVTCHACGHHLTPDAYTDHAATVVRAHQDQTTRQELTKS
ncbi:hypothetical protein ACFXAZ_38440 [Streptomyces sp. NPDC059477]|uniref:hypothetical protein n=1 Tax=Streptomyces sp. NPDC059477 TaxID=3346847 RepID=UPI0036ADF05D